MKKWKMKWLAALLAAVLLASGCGAKEASDAAEKGTQTEALSDARAEAVPDAVGESGSEAETAARNPEAEPEEFAVSLQKMSRGAKSISLENVPEFSGDAYVVLNNNEPEFSQEDFTTESYETYSELDALGRCGAAVANIGQDLMPTEKRTSISQVKPTGWHSVQYDWVDGKNLYNRCHLIGFQLTAENANERNLITGTRFLNVEGMLPFENMVADYINETDHHVLYRVTPVFEGENLVASGVQMEAWSVEDNGEGICFNIYAYNNQPGVVIDYATGESWADENGAAVQEGNTDNSAAGSSVGSSEETEAVQETDNHADSNAAAEYVLNTSTKKFHRPSCPSVGQMKDSNRSDFIGDREELISQGYEPCKTCNP